MPNNITNFLTKQGWKLLIAITAFVGMLLRVKAYFNQHSLFIDEANVARNLYERRYIELFDNLDYEQYVPPIFGVINKLCCHLFGYGELGLRFFPVVLSLLVFFLFYKVLKKNGFHNYVIFFAFYVFSFGYTAMAYSVVLKQYVSDLSVLLAILLLSLVNWKDKNIIISIITLSALGTFFVWYSMPSVFSLAALGGVPFLLAVKDKSSDEMKSWAKIWLIPIVIWVANFAVYYLFILKSDADSDYLQNYHADYFLPAFPTSFDDLQLIWKNYRRVIRGYLMSGDFVTILVSPFWLYGVYLLFKHKFKLLLMLLIPLGLTLFAAMLKQYSLIPRLVFFLLPVIVIPLAYGIISLYQKGIKVKRIPVVVCNFLLFAITVLFLFELNQFSTLKHNFTLEMTKDAIVKMNKEILPNDKLIVHYEGMPAHKYYTNYHPNKIAYSKNTNVHYLHWSEKQEDVINAALQQHNKVWFLFGHTANHVMENNFNKLGENYNVEESKSLYRGGFISLTKKK